MNAQGIYNPIVVRLLRSSVHGLINASVMLITYTGRRSGRRYTTPVSNFREYGSDGHHTGKGRQELACVQSGWRKGEYILRAGDEMHLERR